MNFVPLRPLGILHGATVLLLILGRAITTTAESPSQWAKENLGDLVKLYKHFHQNPELSLHEKNTAARLAAELRKTGAKVTEHVGGHGVVAVVENGDGPTLMLRTDLDALPIAEQTGVPYASQIRTVDQRGATVGVMHACGHDIHITNLVGVARYMTQHKDQWQGTLVMIGQPAEEIGAGAKAMLADGLFHRFPRPDFALALHVDPSMAAGSVRYRSGYSQANTDMVDIKILGRGGHGAYPHTAIDPIVIAARLVLDLQTIVSREVKPVDPAVITVGSIHSGTKHNVIPDSCTLQLTVRSYKDETRALLKSAIERKAKAAAASAGAPAPEITFIDGTPSLFNDEKLAERLGAVFRRTVGEENVLSSEPSMGGEDFSRYGKAGVPILMYGIGSVRAERLAQYQREQQQPPSLHSALFYPDPEPTLATAVTTMTAAALELLGTEEKK